MWSGDVMHIKEYGARGKVLARRKRRHKVIKKSVRRRGTSIIYDLGQFFALVSLLLLVVALVALIRNDEIDASQASIYAFYSLAISVLLLGIVALVGGEDIYPHV